MSWRSMLHGLRALVLATVGAMVVVACTPGDTSSNGSGSSEDGGFASMAVFGSIGPTLLPNFTNSGTARSVTECFGSTLLSYDENTEFMPALAESWELSDDSLTYTFHLRPDTQWSDGEPFTSADIEAAILAMTDPVTTTNWISYVSPIVGAEERKAGESTDLPGLEVMDDLTFSVTLTEPSASFLDLFGTEFQPIPGHITGEIPIEELVTGTFAQAPDVSIGPFTLVSRSGDDSMEMVRNEHYWGGDVQLSRLNVRSMNSTNAVTAMLSGSLDVIPGESIAELDPNDAESLEESPDITVTTYPNSTTQTLYMNTNTLFDDVRVRQAVIQAIDRAAIIDTVLNGAGVVADSVYPEFSPYYEPSVLTTWEQDVEAAKELLSEAGWDESTPVNFLVPTGDTVVEQAAVVIQQQLVAVGINAQIEQVDRNTGISRLLDDHDFDLAIFSNAGLNNLDVSRRFATDSFEGGVNAGGYSNPELDQLMADANTLATYEEQKPLTDEIQRIISEEVPTVMLWYRDSIAAVNTGKLGGVVPQRGGAWLHADEWRRVD